MVQLITILPATPAPLVNLATTGPPFPCRQQFQHLKITAAAKRLFELTSFGGTSKGKGRPEAVQFGFSGAGLAGAGLAGAGLAGVGAVAGRSSARQEAAGGGGQRPVVRAQKRVRFWAIMRGARNLSLPRSLSAQLTK